jgi:hypothetical protein
VDVGVGVDVGDGVSLGVGMSVGAGVEVGVGVGGVSKPLPPAIMMPNTTAMAATSTMTGNGISRSFCMQAFSWRWYCEKVSTLYLKDPGMQSLIRGVRREPQTPRIVDDE